MVLVEHLAIACGAENTVYGKRVWAELALPPRRTPGQRLIDPLRSAAAAIARRLPAFAGLRQRRAEFGITTGMRAHITGRPVITA
ncbi:hypothetical protein [Streptomyces cyaneofuscatus]|uniref:hypothetical protein n=1 Tax=Streptomyces cyaneofuscatus TaxID=66883 RepID=UPI00365B3F2D